MKKFFILLLLLPFFLSCALPHNDPPASPPDVYLDGYGRLIVHGQMVFPIGLHYSKVDYLDEIAAAGFNFVWGDADELSPAVDFHPPDPPFPYTWETFLEQVRANGLYGFFSLGYDEVQALYNGTITWDDLKGTLDAINDNPALLGYQLLDEPESSNFYPDPRFLPPFLTQVGEDFKQRYTGKPTRITNTKVGVYTKFAQAADIMELNIYQLFPLSLTGRA